MDNSTLRAEEAKVAGRLYARGLGTIVLGVVAAVVLFLIPPRIDGDSFDAHIFWPFGLVGIASGLWDIALARSPAFETFNARNPHVRKILYVAAVLAWLFYAIAVTST
jgi:hypothetical protein